MKLTQNILKGYLTTLVGVATVVVTLVVVFRGTMEFVWNGVAGLCIGTALILAPQTIEKIFMKILEKVGVSSSQCSPAVKPENPDQP